MSAKVRLLVFLSLACACGSVAYADQTIEIPASQDVTLFGGSDATTNNTSSGPGMFVGTDGNKAPKRALVEFNIASAIPAGSTINSASLTLYLGMVAGAAGGSSGTTTPRNINLYTISDPWNGSTDGTSADKKDSIPASGFGGTGHGYAPNTGDSTWNYSMYNTTAWTNPGGDFSTTVSSTLTDTSTWTLGEAYTWPSTSMMVLNVQNWLDGTTVNNGWVLKNTDETDSLTFRAFYTAEGAAEQSVPQYAPELTVDYTPAPEPTSMMIFLAAPLFLRRRRSRVVP